MTKYAFKKGWNQIPRVKTEEVRNAIKEQLGITSNPAFYSRMSGKIELKMSEADKVVAIFASYGISDIWGE